MTEKTMMVWLLTKSQTSWNVKSSWPYEASLQTKLVEVMEFQLSYFKSKMMIAVKVLHSICQQIWKTQQCPQDRKSSVFIPISNMKRIASPSSMHHTGCLGLVHWDDPEGWYGEGRRRGVQDGEHVYTRGGFMLMYAKPIQYCKVINLQWK